MMLRPLSRAFAVALTLSAGTASAQTMDFGLSLIHISEPTRPY